MSSADLEALRHWVGHLDRIIQSATNGAERAITHLHSAEQAFAELVAKPAVALGGRGQEARQVHAVVNDSESHITRAKVTLGLARAFLEDGKLAVRQGTEVARRLLAKEVLPVGMRQVRPRPVTVRGEAPAGAHGRSRLAPLT